MPKHNRHANWHLHGSVLLALAVLLATVLSGCTQLLRPTLISPAPVSPTLQPSAGATGVAPPAIPTSEPTAIQAQAFPPGLPTVVPILYQMFDWGTDFQHTNPTWGPVGSVHFYLWRDVNPAPNVYNWQVIDDALAKEAPLKVTLPNGQEILKPVVVQVFPYISSAVGWKADFYDATPGWVYDQIDASSPDDPRPIVEGKKVGHVLRACDKTAVLPMYDSPLWREAYYKMVRAFGARYENNPQVTSVVINTGLDGETQPIKDWYCDWDSTILDQQAGGVRYRFSQFISESMAAYRQAFPRKPIFINNAPGGGGMRKATSDLAATFTPPIGLKNSSLWVDRDSHQGYGTFTGMWDMVNVYSATLPIWLESVFGMGNKEQRYWSLLAGLHYHPDAMDLHPEFFSQSDSAWLRFAVEHLGVNINNTPDVWAVLRDAEYPLQSWGQGGVSGHMGDWFFWLYRPDDAPQSTTERVMRQNVPVAKEHVYSRQTRRTQQAQDQLYMSFNIDDRYPYVAQKPVDEEGNVSYTIYLTILNTGTDTFALQYRNWKGDTVSQVRRKGPELGAVDDWVTVPFVVRDGYLSNNLPGNCDFRISCERDGDEYIHMVRVEGHWGVPPSPTPTRLVTQAPTPAASMTVPAPAGTSTSRPFPTSTAPLPTRGTAVPGPSLAATPTPVPGAVRFDPVEDTYLDKWEPQRSWGDAAKLSARQGDVRAPLLRFDVSALPSGQVVDKATLSINVMGRTNPGALTLTAYQVLRPWNERQATWEQASAGAPWAAAGCNDPAQDRSAVVVAEVTLTGENQWVDLDLTPLVQDWVNDGERNYGVVLKASGSTAVQYDLYSSNHSNEVLHPRLWIVAHGAAPGPTQTSPPPATTTPVAYPPLPQSVTPLATAIRTLHPIPTQTAWPSVTFAPTGSPGPIQTIPPRPTASPASSLTPSPGAEPQLVSLTLRAGEGYTGTLDTFINAWDPDRNYHGQASMSARQGSIQAPLMRFDLTLVPAHASVRRGTLHLYATSRSNPHAITLSVAKVNRVWDTDQVTWNQATASDAWYQAGAQDVGSDRAEGIYASTQVDGEYRWTEWDVTALLQEWVADPVHNEGLLILGEGGVSVQYDFATSSWNPEAYRPYMEIEYLPVRPSPTARPTQTPSVTPSPRVTPFGPTGSHQFQQGVDGYRGNTDTFLDQWNPLATQDMRTELIVRQGGVRSALLRFDLGAIPSGSHVQQAQLYVYVRSRSAGRAMPVQVVGMARPWVAAEATFQRADSQTPWDGMGASAPGSDLSLPPVITSTLANESTWVVFDITGLARQWVASTESNWGLIIRSLETVPVEYEFASADYRADLSLRPKLLIDWDAGPLTPTVTGTPPAPTVTLSPTMTRTETPSPIPTRRKTKLALQQGLANYRGTTDTYLDGWFQTANAGQNSTFSLRQNNIRTAVVRFDLAAVPTDALVSESNLELWTVLGSNPAPLMVKVYRLRRAWDENTTTWIGARTGSLWAAPGADSPDVDREAEALGQVLLTGSQKWVSFDITSAVRYWTQHPDENNGLLLKAVGSTSVEYQCASAQWQQVQQRPKLLLAYERTSDSPEEEARAKRETGVFGWLIIAAAILSLLTLFARKRMRRPDVTGSKRTAF